MSRRVLGASLLSLLAACAAADDVPVRFDASAGAVDVELLGDGFVRFERRRVPLEAAVLQLRQATREMTRSELLRFVVRVRFAEVQNGASARSQQGARARLFNELEIMGVRQIVYL
ncbi:MAG: hypothetical protein ACON4Z_16720 [Planctomycetota bacterium]